MRRNAVLCGNGLKQSVIDTRCQSSQNMTFSCLSFEGQMLRNMSTSIFFFLSPQCFSPYQREIAALEATMKLSSANTLDLDKAKRLSPGVS